MIYSDMNIHLCSGGDLHTMLEDDFSLEMPEVNERIKNILDARDIAIKGRNIMLFNQRLSCRDINIISKSSLRYKNKEINITLLASPDVISVFDDLCELKEAGLKAITLHSYHQHIDKSRYSEYIELAKWADMLKMPILVDGSYGSLDMYRYDNLELVSYIAKNTNTSPIVIMHGGGSRVLEAMHLVESTKNIYLETSFTLPYYIGSSIERDIAFAFKKIGSHRVVYGSDYPYVDFNESLNKSKELLEKYSFSNIEKENIFQNTFSAIFDQGDS